MTDHPFPVGLRVRNHGQQYPEARQGTATIVEVRPIEVQGDALYEYRVRADTRLPGATRDAEWSSEATIPGDFDRDFAHVLEALGGGDASCPCGWTGDDTGEAADHARAYDMCGECWGSGTDAYPCLGICHYCGGAGTLEAEAAGRAAEERAEAEIAAAEFYAEATAAQYDDDPSPYAGTYSEE